jgi:hypothetical protein
VPPLYKQLKQIKGQAVARVAEARGGN